MCRSDRLQAGLPQEDREARLHRDAGGRLEAPEEEDRVHAGHESHPGHDRRRGR